MTLPITCRSCGSSIPSTAESCGICGASRSENAPNARPSAVPKKKESNGLAIGCAIVVLLAIAACIYYVGNSGPSDEVREPAVQYDHEYHLQIGAPSGLDLRDAQPEYKLTADQLFSAYEANEIAADKKCKGKVLVVSGCVEAVGKDISNTMFVALRTRDFFGSVQCFFDDVNESDLVPLRKGMHVSIKGWCGGKFMNVVLQDCVLDR